jgi:hypothetical protein
MDMGRHRPHEQGDALMQGIIQTIDAKRGFGFLQGHRGRRGLFPSPCADPS